MPKPPIELSLRIAPEHPALAGHFPGMPIIPGVLLLDEALVAVETHYAGQWQLASAKFIAPATPGMALQLVLLQEAQQLRFRVQAAGQLLASGVFIPTSWSTAA